MIRKYLEQNIFFPKGLNWVQHWVSQLGILGKFFTLITCTSRAPRPNSLANSRAMSSRMRFFKNCHTLSSLDHLLHHSFYRIKNHRLSFISLTSIWFVLNVYSFTPLAYGISLQQTSHYLQAPLQFCQTKQKIQLIKQQAPVVRRVGSAIHRINHYPLDNSIGFDSVYPLDSDLSGG